MPTVIYVLPKKSFNIHLDKTNSFTTMSGYCLYVLHTAIF